MMQDSRTREKVKLTFILLSGASLIVCFMKFLFDVQFAGRC